MLLISCGVDDDVLIDPHPIVEPLQITGQWYNKDDATTVLISNHKIEYFQFGAHYTGTWTQTGNSTFSITSLKWSKGVHDPENPDGELYLYTPGGAADYFNKQ